jgi:D-sedoheptulose 7-phosphate isomerase
VGAHSQGSRVRRRALALTANSAILTAIANDRDYDAMFESQVEAIGRPGDVLVAISTSGNSRNVLTAVGRAAELGIDTVAFTGAEGRLKDVAGLAVCIPSTFTARIQECYMTAGHIICSLVEDLLSAAGDE